MNTGFTTNEFSINGRVMSLMLDQTTIRNFCRQVSDFSIQEIEYKPFLRFKIANILNELTNGTLATYLQSVLHDRFTGAIVIDSCTHFFKENIDYPYASDTKPYDKPFSGIFDKLDQTTFNILFSTAISHLIGLPNLDSMSGKFYARFTVKHIDESDSYLRQAYRRMELHTDGTYVDEKTDWVLMQKLASENVKGGDSLVLHVDDWEDLYKFYKHSLAKENIQWGSPPSKNVSSKVYHPVYFTENELPCISYIDQFAEPQNMEQGLYLHDIGESLEKDTNTIAIDIPVGSILLINNSVWLHGRDIMEPHENLSRELLRQRGVFFN